MDLNLGGKTVLVTGASKGIGRGLRRAVRGGGRERASHCPKRRPAGDGESGEIRSSHQVDAQVHPLDLSRARCGRRARGTLRRCRHPGQQRRRHPRRRHRPGRRVTLARGVGPEGLRLHQHHAPVLPPHARARPRRHRQRHRSRRREVRLGLHRGHHRQRLAHGVHARHRQHQHRSGCAHPRREPRRGRDRSHPHAAHHPRGVGARRRLALAGILLEAAARAARRRWKRSRTSWCSSLRSARAT